MSETEHTDHSTTDHLVQMANDIGNFFRAEPKREDAINGIAGHINRYWTRRMRQKLLEVVANGDKDLDELPRAAVARIKIESPKPIASQPVSGA